MRSPAPTPGRNRLLENIWQAITNYTRTFVGGQSRPISQQPRYSIGATSISARRFDLEVQEPIVRNDGRTRDLVEMVENSSDVGLALDLRRDAIWSNPTGDDLGWAIAPTLDDNVTPIEPEVFKILERLQEEVIGGMALNAVPELLMGWGDCFVSIGVNERKSRIDRILFPPTFEMFRVEAENELLGFQQRRQASSEKDALTFHPIVCAHARYRWKPPYIYGRPLFDGDVIDDWQSLKAVKFDLAKAARATGINPSIHVMPCEYSSADMKAYREGHESKRNRDGIITDYYLMNGADIKKLSTHNPDFPGLLNALKEYQMSIARKSKIPPYLMGYIWSGAQEIATQPMLNYARSLNSDRMLITHSIIKHICNLELALHGYPKERWKYRVVWPKLVINPFEQQLNPAESDESNLSGIADLDGFKSFRGLAQAQPPDWLTRASNNQIIDGLEKLKYSPIN
jgi:hypothetical protein